MGNASRILLLLLHDNGQIEIKGSNFLGFEFKDAYRRHLTISCVVMKTFETLTWVWKGNLGLKGLLELYYIDTGFKT